MPGCQTQKAPPPAPGSTDTYGTSSVESAPALSEPIKPVAYRAETELSEPMRPVGRQTTRPLDPAFNAGLESVENGAILEPELLPVENEPMVSSASRSQLSTYTVQSGDTLSGIARKNQTTVASIKELNGLSGNTIYVGQGLKIKGDSAPVVVVASDSAGSETYTVVSGDTLSRIASRYGVSARELKQANDLSGDTIYVGQKLYIPGSGSVAPTKKASNLTTPVTNVSGSTYTVQSGDSPIKIARKLGVNSNELMSANGITDPRRLVVGQVLIVPGSGNRSSGVSASTQGVKPAATATRAKSSESGALVVEATRPKEIKPAPSVSELESLLESDDIPLMELEEVDSKTDRK